MQCYIHIYAYVDTYKCLKFFLEILKYLFNLKYLSICFQLHIYSVIYFICFFMFVCAHIKNIFITKYF